MRLTLLTHKTSQDKQQLNSAAKHTPVVGAVTATSPNDLPHALSEAESIPEVNSYRDMFFVTVFGTLDDMIVFVAAISGTNGSKVSSPVRHHRTVCIPYVK